MDIQVETDVALIGAGPIGLEMAVALKKETFAYSHIEAGCLGATVDWYAPGTHFFSSPERIAIAGVPLCNVDQTKATREQYLTYLRSVALQHQLIVRTHERVVEAKRSDNGDFMLSTIKSTHGVGGPSEQSYLPDPEATKKSYKAKKVILSIGDMHIPRLLGVPGEGLAHVSHYLQDPHRYYGSKVLIVGGKNSAVEAAIRLYRAGAQVTLCYRQKELDKERIKYWLYPEIQFLMKKGVIEFRPESVVTKILERTVEMKSAQNGGKTVAHTFDSVLLLTGYEQDGSLFDQLGVKLHGAEKKPEFNEQTMETNVSGVYVAGTAVAGTQLRGVKEFIETSHVHVERILASLKGEQPPEGGSGAAGDFLEN